jgi:hypothetical protein
MRLGREWNLSRGLRERIISGYEYSAPEDRIWCPWRVEERTRSSGKSRPWARIEQSCQAHSAERRQGELKQIWRLGHSCVASTSKRQSHRNSRQKSSSVCRRWKPNTESRSRERESEGEGGEKEAPGPGRYPTLLSPSPARPRPPRHARSTRQRALKLSNVPENSRAAGFGLTARRPRRLRMASLVQRTHSPSTRRLASTRYVCPTHQPFKCVRAYALSRPEVLILAQ